MPVTVTFFTRTVRDQQIGLPAPIWDGFKPVTLCNTLLALVPHTRCALVEVGGWLLSSYLWSNGWNNYTPIWTGSGSVRVFFCLCSWRPRSTDLALYTGLGRGSRKKCQAVCLPAIVLTHRSLENPRRFKPPHCLTDRCFCHAFTWQEAAYSIQSFCQTLHIGAIARAAARGDAQTHHPPPSFQKPSLQLPQTKGLRPSLPRPALAALPPSGAETLTRGPLEAEMSPVEIFLVQLTFLPSSSSNPWPIPNFYTGVQQHILNVTKTPHNYSLKIYTKIDKYVNTPICYETIREVDRVPLSPLQVTVWESLARTIWSPESWWYYQIFYHPGCILYVYDKTHTNHSSRPLWLS